MMRKSESVEYKEDTGGREDGGRTERTMKKRRSPEAE